MPDTDHAIRRSHLTTIRLVHRNLAFQQIHVADKVRHKAAVRMLVDFLRRADLEYTSVAHHGNTRSHGHRFILIVGHHHAGHADRLQNVHQFELRAFTQLFVQRAKRLVKQ